MELALTFGAVGDFIAITVLIKDIIAALDDSHGSGKEYRELVQQLSTLSQTLDAVQKAFENPHLTHSLECISGITLDTVAQTKKCLVSLLDQINKYEPTLAATSSVKKTSLNGIRGRVQWKLNEKDIDRFRAELAVHTGALKLVLELAAIQVLQRNHDSLIREQSAAEGRTAAAIHQSEASLGRFLDFIGRSIISKLDIIYSLGAQLRILTCQIASMIYSITGDLTSIKDILMRLDRGPSDEHFILEDITGRVFPIHLKTITSWEILQFILSERFKGKKGARRVQHQRYTLWENKTQRLINRSIPWDSAFSPYQKVNMSLMCNDQNLNLSLSNEAKGKGRCVRGDLNCPFCKTSLDGAAPLGVETECQNCGRFYTRAVEIHHGQLERNMPFSRHSKNTLNEQGFMECKSSKHDTTQSQPEMESFLLTSNYDSDEEDVQGFVRVRLISKRIVKSQHILTEPWKLTQHSCGIYIPQDGMQSSCSQRAFVV